MTKTRRTKGLTERTEYKALAKRCKMLENQTQMANPKPNTLTNKVEKEKEHLSEGVAQLTATLAHKQHNQPHKEPKTTSTNLEKNHQKLKDQVAQLKIQMTKFIMKRPRTSTNQPTKETRKRNKEKKLCHKAEK